MASDAKIVLRLRLNLDTVDCRSWVERVLRGDYSSKAVAKKTGGDYPFVGSAFVLASQRALVIHFMKQYRQRDSRGDQHTSLLV